MTFKLTVDPRALNYREVIRPDSYQDGSIAYIAEIPELPGCKAHGRTPEEAQANLEDAKREYLEALTEAGIELPAPAAGMSLGNVIWSMPATLDPTPCSTVVFHEAPSYEVLI
jgi:predicted RNase H-like HicB family nuclease